MISDFDNATAPTVRSRMANGPLLPSRIDKPNNVDGNSITMKTKIVEGVQTPEAESTKPNVTTSSSINHLPLSKSPRKSLSPVRTQQSKKPPMNFKTTPVRQTRGTYSPKRTPPSTNGTSYDRTIRPSFQGLSVIDGKVKSRTDKSEDDERAARMIRERRRRSLDMMKRSAQSDQIRNIIKSTMEDISIEYLASDRPVEDRLKDVLTKAKESGMTADEIFSFFNGGNPNTSQISKGTFREAIDKLGDSYLLMTDEELLDLVQKFDKNGDGFISIDEFKHYCLTEISSVTWKAERQRLERSGEMKKLQAQLSRKFIPSKICYECGEEVYRTSKLFWRTNNDVEIRFYYSVSLDVITIQLYDHTKESELPSIFICKNKVEYQNKNLEEYVKKALILADAHSIVKESEDVVRKRATWAFIGKYLTDRLKLKDVEQIDEGNEEGDDNDVIPELECSHIPEDAGCIPYLSKFSGDTFDTLLIPKPMNLAPPPKIIPNKTVAIAFDDKMRSLQKDSRIARQSRESAGELSALISTVLDELNNEEE